MPTTSLLQLLDAITRKGSEIGVKLVPSGGRTPALHFDFGFKIRSFFPTATEGSINKAERGFFAAEVSL